MKYGQIFSSQIYLKNFKITIYSVFFNYLRKKISKSDSVQMLHVFCNSYMLISNKLFYYDKDVASAIGCLLELF